MSLTDPLSNMLTNILNASRAKKETVDIPASRMVQEILTIFKNDGYIENYRLMKDNKQGILKVYLRYEQNKKPVIGGAKRISKSGLRVYTKQQEIPRVLNGLGTAIVSTSKGVMSGKEARKQKVGGEVLCYIW